MCCITIYSIYSRYRSIISFPLTKKTPLSIFDQVWLKYTSVDAHPESQYNNNLTKVPMLICVFINVCTYRKANIFIETVAILLELTLAQLAWSWSRRRFSLIIEQAVNWWGSIRPLIYWPLYTHPSSFSGYHGGTGSLQDPGVSLPVAFPPSLCPNQHTHTHLDRKNPSVPASDDIHDSLKKKLATRLPRASMKQYTKSPSFNVAMSNFVTCTVVVTNSRAIKLALTLRVWSRTN